MRNIAEVVEDIKNILNSVERAEECTGETLVDIDELLNEILTISSRKRSQIVGKLSILAITSEAYRVEANREKNRSLVDQYTGEIKAYRKVIEIIAREG